MVELSRRHPRDELPATRADMDIVARRFNATFSYRWARIIEFLKLHYVLQPAERLRPLARSPAGAHPARAPAGVAAAKGATAPPVDPTSTALKKSSPPPATNTCCCTAWASTPSRCAARPDRLAAARAISSKRPPSPDACWAECLGTVTSSTHFAQTASPSVSFAPLIMPNHGNNISHKDYASSPAEAPSG